MGWNWDNFGYKLQRRPENDLVLMKQQTQGLPRHDSPTLKAGADPAAPGDARYGQRRSKAPLT